MSRHVVLVGLMGSGKTSVGRRLAKAMGRSFVDADEAFVGRTGRTIAEVFATEGEAAFRELEAELVADLLGVAEPLVVAAGGGAVVTEQTRKLLAAPGGPFVVYLHALPAFLASRAEAKAHRPLLAGADPEEVFARLYAERDGWYREVAGEVVEVQSFHDWGSSPKRAMARHIAELALR